MARSYLNGRFRGQTGRAADGGLKKSSVKYPNVCFAPKRSLRMCEIHRIEGQLTAYFVEKLRFSAIRNFTRIFRLPGARVTDQSCRFELRQAGFSFDFCYPLVHTVRNVAQIANKIAAILKTEFFNRIGQKQSLISLDWAMSRHRRFS